MPSSKASCTKLQDGRFIDLNLGQIFRLDQFLNLYDVDNATPIQGVFYIEKQKTGDAVFVESSLDVHSAVKVYVSDNNLPIEIYSIRVQTFKNPDEVLLNSYKEELLRQTGLVTSKVEEFEDASSDVIVSPFATGALLPESDDYDYDGDDYDDDYDDDEDGAAPIPVKVQPTEGKVLEFTVENVNKVLDEVRPYLILDGGNVTVVNINSKDRSIQLKLEGACGSCPSSTVYKCKNLPESHHQCRLDTVCDVQCINFNTQQTMHTDYDEDGHREGP